MSTTSTRKSSPPALSAPPSRRLTDTFFPTIGRLLVALPFLYWSADILWSAPKYEADVERAIGRHPSLTGVSPNLLFLIHLTGLLMLVCSFSVTFGFASKIASIPLAIILFFSTIIYHLDTKPIHAVLTAPSFSATDYRTVAVDLCAALHTVWQNISREAANQIIKNLGIIGGLFLVTSHGGGRLALEHASPTTVGWGKKKSL